MNAGAAVKRPRENAQLAAGAKRRRRNSQLIGDFVARPAFLHAFQAAVNQLEAVIPSQYRRSFSANALNACDLSIYFTVPRFTLTQITFRGLFETGVCRLFSNPTSPLFSLHPHPAGTPDALFLVLVSRVLLPTIRWTER